MDRCRYRRLLTFCCCWLSFSTGVVYAESEAVVAVVPVAELQLTPRLCIRGTSDEVCEINVLIEWNSDSLGKYCLHREQSDDPVKCWEQQKIGSIQERVQITRDLDYWLVWFASADELDRQVLALLTAKPEDRRKSRRRRHAWSVF